MVTVSRLEKTPGDNYTHLNTTITVSWLSLAKHCIISNTIDEVLAGGYNIEQKLQPFLLRKLL